MPTKDKKRKSAVSSSVNALLKQIAPSFSAFPAGKVSALASLLENGVLENNTTLKTTLKSERHSNYQSISVTMENTPYTGIRTLKIEWTADDIAQKETLTIQETKNSQCSIVWKTTGTRATSSTIIAQRELQKIALPLPALDQASLVNGSHWAAYQKQPLPLKQWLVRTLQQLRHFFNRKETPVPVYLKINAAATSPLRGRALSGHYPDGTNVRQPFVYHQTEQFLQPKPRTRQGNPPANNHP